VYIFVICFLINQNPIIPYFPLLLQTLLLYSKTESFERPHEHKGFLWFLIELFSSSTVSIYSAILHVINSSYRTFYSSSSHKTELSLEKSYHVSSTGAFLSKIHIANYIFCCMLLIHYNIINFATLSLCSRWHFTTLN